MATTKILLEPHESPEEPLEPLQEAPDQPVSTSGWSRIKSRNSSARKARTQFRLRISSTDWRILPKPTGGRMPKPTKILPTHSGIQLANGSHQWSTGTTMIMINPCGQTLRRFSSKNMPFKRTKANSGRISKLGHEAE